MPRYWVLIGAMVALAACGSPTPQPTRAASTPQTTAAETTITGTVQPGAQENCLLLKTDREVYLLLGGDREELAAGGVVVVTGEPRHGQPATCRQGVPFVVSRVERP